MWKGKCTRKSSTPHDQRPLVDTLEKLIQKEPYQRCSKSVQLQEVPTPQLMYRTLLFTSSKFWSMCIDSIRSSQCAPLVSMVLVDEYVTTQSPRHYLVTSLVSTPFIRSHDHQQGASHRRTTFIVASLRPALCTFAAAHVAKAGSFLMSSGTLIPHNSKNADFIPIGNRCEGIRSLCSHLWYNSRSRKKVLAQVEHDTFQFWWLKVNI